MPTDALMLQEVSVRHPGAALPALDRVSLRAGRAQLLALLGPSGCGKSTLLRVVAGLEPHARGSVCLAGQDLSTTPPAARPVGFVFQHYALFPHLDVCDNVAFGLRAAGVSDGSAVQRAQAALALVGLPDMGSRSAATLSGGQQQRVALARALALEPALLLLDEPLSNLDHGLRRQLREDIRALQQRLGLAGLYVTHDHAEALAVADRVVVMHQGRIEQSGTPRQLYEQPASAFVAAFMGETQLYPVQIDEAGRTWLGPLQLPLPSLPPCPPAPTPPQAGEPSATRDPTPGPASGGQVAVRPHAWRLSAPSTAGLPARVLRSAYLGSVVEYTLATEVGVVLALDPRTRRRHEDGAPLSLTLAAHGVALLPG